MRVLFTGYAPVHFLCFKPLYDHLVAMPDVKVELSGGTRTKTPDGYLYDHEAMYGSLRLPEEGVVPVGALAQRGYDLMFSANTRRIEPRSVGRRIQIFHGMSFRNRAIRPETDGADHYFLLGPYMQRGFDEAGVLPMGDPRTVEIGFPKTDRLVDGSLDRADVLAGLGVSGERPVLLFAPTGERRNSLETMGEELIKHLAELDCYDLLIKPHDHPHGSVDWGSRLAPFEGEHVRLVRQLDVIPTLFITDLLITDASSVANEYALLDRPIVFLDVPELLEITRDKRARLDLETWGRKGGQLARDPREAVEAIQVGLNGGDGRSHIRQALTVDMFFNPGRATDAAMAWLRDEFKLP